MDYFTDIRKWVTINLSYGGIEHSLVSLDHNGTGTIVCRFRETPIRDWSDEAKEKLRKTIT